MGAAWEEHIRMNNTADLIYGGSEPISETLLGRITQWKPTGCIAHNDAVARCFGLEIARLLLDASFRDF